MSAYRTGVKRNGRECSVKLLYVSCEEINMKVFKKATVLSLALCASLGIGMIAEAGNNPIKGVSVPTHAEEISGTNAVEGTLTDKLKKSIDANNIRIVYDVYFEGWKNRYTFAKRGKDFYVQKDYPIFLPVKYKSKGFLGFGVERADASQKKKKIENKTGRKPIKFNNAEGVPIDYVNEKTRNLFNSFMYGSSDGLDKALEILGEPFLDSNALKDVLFATPEKHAVKLVKTYEQIIDNELCVAEEFSSQELTEEGIPQDEEKHFTFYYKDGKLAYFDKNINNNIPHGKAFGIFGIPIPEPVCLNKVIALDQNIDGYIFDSLKHYEMGELKKRGE